MRLTMRERPPSSRPRERLLAHGAHSLTESELVAILVRTGTRGTSAADLGDRLLRAFRSLRGLADASPEELAATPGVGPAKAAAILAAFELGKRLGTEPRARQVVRDPASVARLVMDEMRYLDREQFRAVLLDTKHRVLGIPTISVGGLSASPIHAREVFKEAIRRSAAAVILVHNHPSGNPEPSADDVRVTAALRAAGQVVGIEVLDHLIVGEGQYVSLRERGLGFDRIQRTR